MLFGIQSLPEIHIDESATERILNRKINFEHLIQYRTPDDMRTFYSRPEKFIRKKNFGRSEDREFVFEKRITLKECSDKKIPIDLSYFLNNEIGDDRILTLCKTIQDNRYNNINRCIVAYVSENTIYLFETCFCTTNDGEIYAPSIPNINGKNISIMKYKIPEFLIKFMIKISEIGELENNCSRNKIKSLIIKTKWNYYFIHDKKVHIFSS